MQTLNWDTAAVSKKTRQRLYFLRQLRKFNVPQNHTVCSLHFHHCLVQNCNHTGQEHAATGRSGLLKRLLEATCSPIKELYGPGSGNRQVTFEQTLHELFCSSPLVGATELCTPKQPDADSFSPQDVTVMNTEQWGGQKKPLCNKPCHCFNAKTTGNCSLLKFAIVFFFYIVVLIFPFLLLF